MIVAMVEGCTRIIGKSQGYLGLPIRDEIVDDPVSGLVNRMVTVWEPTPAEVDRIVHGAKIEVWLLGEAHPPILVEVGQASDET